MSAMYQRAAINNQVNPMSEKLQKVLARAGQGSRREMEALITAGRVSVDGKVAMLGDRVEVNAVIRVDGHQVKTRAAEEADLPRAGVSQARRGDVYPSRSGRSSHRV